MRDVRINDSCVKCHLQRSNAIRRPKNRKIFEHHVDAKKRNVYIEIVNQEKERLLIVDDDDEKPETLIENQICDPVIKDNV